MGSGDAIRERDVKWLFVRKLWYTVFCGSLNTSCKDGASNCSTDDDGKVEIPMVRGPRGGGLSFS